MALKTIQWKKCSNSAPHFILRWFKSNFGGQFQIVPCWMKINVSTLFHWHHCFLTSSSGTGCQWSSSWLFFLYGTCGIPFGTGHKLPIWSTDWSFQTQPTFLHSVSFYNVKKIRKITPISFRLSSSLISLDGGTNLPTYVSQFVVFKRNSLSRYGITHY